MTTITELAERTAEQIRNLPRGCAEDAAELIQRAIDAEVARVTEPLVRVIEHLTEEPCRR